MGFPPAKLFGGAAIFAPGGDGGKKGLRNLPASSRFSSNRPPMAAPKKRIRGNGAYFLPSWTA
jgi:hypothetical protein